MAFKTIRQNFLDHKDVFSYHKERSVPLYRQALPNPAFIFTNFVVRPCGATILLREREKVT